MTAETGAVTARQAFTPLEAFSGAIARTKTGPLYSAGLMIVAFAMVLLPLIYLALIAFTAWAVLFHLIHDTWIFEGASGRGGLYRLIAYTDLSADYWRAPTPGKPALKSSKRVHSRLKAEC